jgi:serine/threonine protein phosphatase PrpC
MELRFAIVSDAGVERPNNEDSSASWADGRERLLVAVADGVGGEEGGEVASRTAVDVTLSAYRDSPPTWGPAKRLYRAVQQANIVIHDRALIVPELRRMSTTLTAVVVDDEIAHAAHVGDSRLYLVRDGSITQKTKDHTVAASRRRAGLIGAERAKNHPERSTLTRSLGRELIAAIDRLTFEITGGDVLLVCTDGLYNVVPDDELRSIVTDADPDEACRTLVETANGRGSPDNLTAAVVRALGKPRRTGGGWRRWLGLSGGAREP